MPESMAGEVRPRPVAQMTMESPGCTGLVGVTSSPLSARAMVASPVVGPATPLRKTLGAAGGMEKVKLALVAPGGRRATRGVPVAVQGHRPLDRRAVRKDTG